MKKVLLIETLSQINGGQKMSLLIADMLQESGDYKIVWAIPGMGILSERLVEKGYRYFLLGNLTLPAGVKEKSVIFKYASMSLRVVSRLNRLVCTEGIDIIYAPGPAALPWSALCGYLTGKPVVWHLHHIFLDGMTKKLLNFCGHFKSVKLIIAVSRVVGDQIENEKVDNKVNVLYNPADFVKYQNGNIDNIKDLYPFSMNF